MKWLASAGLKVLTVFEKGIQASVPNQVMLSLSQALYADLYHQNPGNPPPIILSSTFCQFLESSSL